KPARLRNATWLNALWVKATVRIEDGRLSRGGRNITMADRRYQDRPYPSDDYGRSGDQHGRAENDPLAELARLTGKPDPFAARARAAARPPAPPAPEQPAQSYAPQGYEDQYEEPPPPPGPPSWMRRANVQAQPAAPEHPGYAPTVNPMQRF